MTFTLVYDLEPCDVEELFKQSEARRKRRALAALNLLWVPAAAAITVFTVVVSVRKQGPDSAGTPVLLYAADVLCWAIVALAGRSVWRLSPRRMARRAWRANARLRGRHKDEVGSQNVTSTSPDGTMVCLPWARIDSIHETENAFHLVDDQGRTLNTLPKRGLTNQELIPSLRDFLNASVRQQGSAASASMPAHELRP